MEQNKDLVLEYIKILTDPTTNEGKTLELLPTKSGYYEITDALLKMAEWKDEQIKKLKEIIERRSKYEREFLDETLKAEKQALIDKACEWLKNNMYEGTCEQILSKKPYPFMRDFINEFKQAMEGSEDSV